MSCKELTILAGAPSTGNYLHNATLVAEAHVARMLRIDRCIRRWHL
jgi:hypothetical protein